MMISFSGGETTAWPARHVLLYPALPWNLYYALERTFPDWRDVLGARAKALAPNTRYDMSAKRLMASDTAKVWKTFIAEHVSHETWGALYQALQPGEKFAGMTAGLRGRDKTDILMDCQLGINTPSKTEGRVIGPHVDSANEVVAGLLYMPVEGDDAGGDLTLYRHKGKPRFIGKKEVADEDCEAVATVPYRPNQAVFFANSIEAVHGVTPRKPSDKPRRLVNFLAETFTFNFRLPR